MALFHVRAAEELHQLRDELRHVRVDLRQLSHPLRRGQHLVRDVQPDHRHRPARAENDLRGFRVCQDVELGAWGHVARVVRATHQGDATHALHQLGIHAGEQGNVGQRPRGHEGDGPRFVLSDNVRDEVHRVAGIQLGPGGGQLRAVQAAIPVDFLRNDLRRHHRAVRPGGEGNAGDVAYSCQRQGILGDLLQRLVARHRRDRQQIQVWVSPGQEHGNRIVVPRIAVQDDLLCHLCVS